MCTHASKYASLTIHLWHIMISYTHLPYYLAYFLPLLLSLFYRRFSTVAFYRLLLSLVFTTNKKLMPFLLWKNMSFYFISYPDIWRLRSIPLRFTTPFTTPFLPQTTPFSDKIRYLCIFTKSPQTLENTDVSGIFRSLKNMQA